MVGDMRCDAWMSLPLLSDARACPVPFVTRAAATHIDRDVARGDLARVDRGVYAPKTLWDALAPWDRYLARVHAVALRHPDAIFVRESAAALRGIAVFGEPRDVHAVAQDAGRTRIRGTTRFHAAERMPRFERLGSFNVATAGEVAADAARLSHPAVALAIADSALRADGTLTVADIGDLAETHPSSRGRSRARWVCARATGTPESPLESVSIAVIEWLGFPAAESQVWIGDDRVDLFWRRWNVAGEADGDVKYSGAMGDAREALRARRTRDGRLIARGVAAVPHWSWADAIDAAPLRTALLSAGIPIVRAPQPTFLATLPTAVRGH